MAYKKREKNTDGSWKATEETSSASNNDPVASVVEQFQRPSEYDQIEDYSQIQWEQIFDTAQKADPLSGGIDSTQKKFAESEFARDVNSYPAPEQLAKYLMEHNQPVPRFLLPVTHPMHIPPHLVAAAELLKMNLADTAPAATRLAA